MNEKAQIKIFTPKEFNAGNNATKSQKSQFKIYKKLDPNLVGGVDDFLNNREVYDQKIKNNMTNVDFYTKNLDQEYNQGLKVTTPLKLRALT